MQFVLRSEFSAVAIRKCTDANGEQLEIVDLRSGDAMMLDPLELEALARSTVNYQTEIIVGALLATQVGPDELPASD